MFPKKTTILDMTAEEARHRIKQCGGGGDDPADGNQFRVCISLKRPSLRGARAAYTFHGTITPVREGVSLVYTVSPNVGGVLFLVLSAFLFVSGLIALAQGSGSGKFLLVSVAAMVFSALFTLAEQKEFLEHFEAMLRAGK